MKTRVVWHNDDYTLQIWCDINGWMSVVGGIRDEQEAIERAQKYAKGPHVVWEWGEMMPEHTPITDAELDEIVHRDGQDYVLVTELQKARRLLRAVEWLYVDEIGVSICTECEKTMNEGHSPDCELGSYLDACEGAKDE